MLRVALGTAVTVAPMVIFFHDNIGFIAKVEGASMQPALNPEGQRTSDYVFLNKWKAKNHHYIRGEVVSLINYLLLIQTLVSFLRFWNFPGT
eukprot:XP_014784825.1 PREDICTED: mitochondrial inner membrane protease subunit 2-like isoform X2 [Octopus bimaculoides]